MNDYIDHGYRAPTPKTPDAVTLDSKSRRVLAFLRDCADGRESAQLDAYLASRILDAIAALPRREGETKRNFYAESVGMGMQVALDVPPRRAEGMAERNEIAYGAGVREGRREAVRECREVVKKQQDEFDRESNKCAECDDIGSWAIADEILAALDAMEGK